MKLIRTKSRDNRNIIRYNTYYINDNKIVNNDFEAVEAIKGRVVVEKEISKEEIEKLIDRYADFIENYTQQKQAIAKNARIESFLEIA